MSRPLRSQFPRAYYPVMNWGLVSQPLLKTNLVEDRLQTIQGLMQDFRGVGKAQPEKTFASFTKGSAGR